MPTARVRPSGEKASDSTGPRRRRRAGAGGRRTTPRRGVDQDDGPRPLADGQGRAVGADRQGGRLLDGRRSRRAAAGSRPSSVWAASSLAAPRQVIEREPSGGVEGGEAGPGRRPSIGVGQVEPGRRPRGRRPARSGRRRPGRRPGSGRRGSGPAIAVGAPAGWRAVALAGRAVGRRRPSGPVATGRSGSSTSATGSGSVGPIPAERVGFEARPAAPGRRSRRRRAGPGPSAGPRGGSSPGRAQSRSGPGVRVASREAIARRSPGPKASEIGSSPDSGSWTCATGSTIDQSAIDDGWLAARVRPSGEKARSSTRSRVGRAATRACEVRSQSSTPPPAGGGGQERAVAGAEPELVDEALAAAQARQRLGCRREVPDRDLAARRRRPAGRPAPAPGPWRWPGRRSAPSGVPVAVPERDLGLAGPGRGDRRPVGRDGQQRQPRVGRGRRASSRRGGEGQGRLRGVGVVAVPEGDPRLLGLGARGRAAGRAGRGGRRSPGSGRRPRRRPRRRRAPSSAGPRRATPGVGDVEEADARRRRAGSTATCVAGRRRSGARRAGPGPGPWAGRRPAPGRAAGRAAGGPSRPASPPVDVPDRQLAVVGAAPAIRRPPAPKARPCGPGAAAIGGRASTSRIVRNSSAWSRSLTRIAGSGPSSAAS